MSDYLVHLHLAYWHATKCAASLAKARRALGDDLLDDEPLFDGVDGELGPPMPAGKGRSRRSSRLRLIRYAAPNG
jgi:hypothetical protein